MEFSKNLKKRLKVMDAFVLEGRIIEAADAFFHPEVHTQEVNGKETNGLVETRLKLENFIQRVRRVNEILLHSQTIGEDVTMSEFTFDFTEINGNQQLWNEVLRRKWKDGLVIDEKYYRSNF